MVHHISGPALGAVGPPILLQGGQFTRMVPGSDVTPNCSGGGSFKPIITKGGWEVEASSSNALLAKLPLRQFGMEYSMPERRLQSNVPVVAAGALFSAPVLHPSRRGVQIWPNCLSVGLMNGPGLLLYMLRERDSDQMPFKE